VIGSGLREDALVAKPTAFPKDEYDRRLGNVRTRMDALGLRGALISAPENIYYLTGLDHQGYFAYECLVVPVDGDPILVTRAMERATVRDQVPWLTHMGYSDGVEPIPAPRSEFDDILMGDVNETGQPVGLRPWEMSAGVSVHGPKATDDHIPVAETLKALHAAGLDSGRIGLEKRSSFLPFHVAEGIVNGLARAEWVDVSDLVNDCRIVQSKLELACTRRAARLTDSMLLSAIAAAGPSVRERDVMAAVYDVMFRRGGTYPGFVPLIRSTRTLAHEHGTWSEGVIKSRDVLFVELSGCVRRYHAPAGRLVFIGRAPARSQKMQGLCLQAMENAARAIGPGAVADEVYRAWQETLDRAGLTGYTRHHCGYAIGIGFPPSWSGGGTPRGLRQGSRMRLEVGMVFHLMSWLLRTGRGDSFLSDTVVVTDDGCEFLTTASRELAIR
jgi:Xaa-Pro dipeptidase